MVNDRLSLPDGEGRRRMAGRRHVEIYEGADGWWRFRLVAGNGEKQDASQAYHGTRSQSKYGARRGAVAAHPDLPIVVVTE